MFRYTLSKVVQNGNKLSTAGDASYGVTVNEVDGVGKSHSALTYEELMPILEHFNLETPAQLVGIDFSVKEHLVKFSLGALLDKIN